MPNMMDRAADRLRGRWQQGNYGKPDGPVCLMGAIGRSMDASELGTYEYREMMDALADEAYQLGYSNAVEFNDDPHTTEADVLLLMKNVSQRLDQS